MESDNNVILKIKNLRTQFFTEAGVVHAVDGIDFNVKRGEVVGLVGESGCGKSVTSLSIMRLIGQPGRIVEGEIVFDNQDLLELPESRMVDIRGNRISMIFQQPQSSLNPVFRVGEQLSEVLQIHQDVGKEAGEKRAIELLAEGLALARKVGESPWMVKALVAYGLALEKQGRFSEAEVNHFDALRIATALRDRLWEGFSLLGLGLTSFEQGDFSRAGPYFERALEAVRAAGSTYGEGMMLTMLGRVARASGECARYGRLVFELERMRTEGL